MDAPPVEHKEDIEDTCMPAIKERDIEDKLKQLNSEWTCQELIFQSRGELLLLRDLTAKTVILGSLMNNR